jgi:hypothetical protein
MVKYLGELEDNDVVIFVIEHLRVKYHNSPTKLLVEGPEPIHTIQNIIDLRRNHGFRMFRMRKLPSLHGT